MAYQAIPLKTFMAGSIVPNPGILAAVDGGLMFFGGMGIALLGLVVAEKMGLDVNKSAVRWCVRVSACVFVLWAIYPSGFLRHLLFG